MSNKRPIFVVECQKISKSKAKKFKSREGGVSNSDEQYINVLNKTFLDTQHQPKFISLGGKSSYNHANTKKSIKEYIKKDKTLGIETDIIYVLDWDNPSKNPEQNKLNKDIKKYCEENGYPIIWFNVNIEHVLLGKQIGDNKTQNAAKFSISDQKKGEIQKKLSANNDEVIGLEKSNYLMCLKKCGYKMKLSENKNRK